jgi:calcyphosin
LGLGRCFRRLYGTGIEFLNLDEFTTGLAESGFSMSPLEIEDIFSQFDPEGTGSINMTEFLIGVRVSI